LREIVRSVSPSSPWCGLLDPKRQLLVGPVNLGVRHLPEEVVQLGGHAVVAVADPPAEVA
jgi:hypothetical protein